MLVAYIMKPKAGYDYLATAAHFAAESSTGTNVNVCDRARRPGRPGRPDSMATSVAMRSPPASADAWQPRDLLYALTRGRCEESLERFACGVRERGM